MTDQSALHIPRTAFGLLMAGATVVAIAAAWFMAGQLGGTGPSATSVVYAMLIGSLATFLPVVLRIGKDYWGVAVLCSGVGRSLIIIALCYLFRENNPSIIARPLFMSAASGAILLLIIETTAAVKILSAIDRRRLTPSGPNA